MFWRLSCPRFGILGNFCLMKIALNVKERKLRNPSGEKTLRNTGTKGERSPFYQPSSPQWFQLDRKYLSCKWISVSGRAEKKLIVCYLNTMVA